MNQFYKNMMVLAILLVVLLSLLTLWTGQRPEAKKDMPYSEFIQKLGQGGVGEVAIQGEKIEGKTSSDVIAAILRTDPPPLTVYPLTGLIRSLFFPFTMQKSRWRECRSGLFAPIAPQK